MSKKAKLYLLIIINLIAWGYVANMIYGALQGDDEIELGSENISIKKIEETKKDDSIVLLLNYADPFLKGGHFSKENKTHTSSGAQQKVPKPVPQPKLIKPETVPVSLDIKYVGMVKNSEKGTQTAMMSINGKSYFVKQKDVIENLTIQEISSDFIKIKKGKETIIINK